MDNPYEPPEATLWEPSDRSRPTFITLALFVGSVCLFLVGVTTSSPVARFFAYIFLLIEICICRLIYETKKFNERYPPIDDQEFIRRCTPGVNVEIALRVRRLVSDATGVDYDRIYPEQSFAEDLDCC